MKLLVQYLLIPLQTPRGQVSTCLITTTHLMPLTEQMLSEDLSKDRQPFEAMPHAVQA